MLVVIRDVTAQQRLEKTRKDFVANVSHELKTPIARLKLGAETLSTSLEHDPASARRFARGIEEDVDRLAALVADLLQLSRYEAPDVSSAFEAVQLNEIVTDVLGRLWERPEELGLTLTAELDPTLPPITGSREQLASLAANLIDNALKYTPAGGEVRVSTRMTGRRVALEVADTGVGIPAQDQPRVFERFYRVDKARSRRGGRTGLGLSIVKHVADAHRAKIDLASMPGKGTTFTVAFEPAQDRSASGEAVV